MTNNNGYRQLEEEPHPSTGSGAATRIDGANSSGASNTGIADASKTDGRTTLGRNAAGFNKRVRQINHEMAEAKALNQTGITAHSQVLKQFFDDFKHTMLRASQFAIRPDVAWAVLQAVLQDMNQANSQANQPQAIANNQTKQSNTTYHRRAKYHNARQISPHRYILSNEQPKSSLALLIEQSRRSRQAIEKEHLENLRHLIDQQLTIKQQEQCIQTLFARPRYGTNPFLDIIKTMSVDEHRDIISWLLNKQKMGNDNLKRQAGIALQNVLRPITQQTDIRKNWLNSPQHMHGVVKDINNNSCLSSSHKYECLDVFLTDNVKKDSPFARLLNDSNTGPDVINTITTDDSLKRYRQQKRLTKHFHKQSIVKRNAQQGTIEQFKNQLNHRATINNKVWQKLSGKTEANNSIIHSLAYIDDTAEADAIQARVQDLNQLSQAAFQANRSTIKKHLARLFKPGWWKKAKTLWGLWGDDRTTVMKNIVDNNQDQHAIELLKSLTELDLNLASEYINLFLTKNKGLIHTIYNQISDRSNNDVRAKKQLKTVYNLYNSTYKLSDTAFIASIIENAKNLSELANFLREAQQNDIQFDEQATTVLLERFKQLNVDKASSGQTNIDDFNQFIEFLVTNKCHNNNHLNKQLIKQYNELIEGYESKLDAQQLEDNDINEVAKNCVYNQEQYNRMHALSEWYDALLSNGLMVYQNIPTFRFPAYDINLSDGSFQSMMGRAKPVCDRLQQAAQSNDVVDFVQKLFVAGLYFGEITQEESIWDYLVKKQSSGTLVSTMKQRLQTAEHQQWFDCLMESIYMLSKLRSAGYVSDDSITNHEQTVDQYFNRNNLTEQTTHRAMSEFYHSIVKGDANSVNHPVMVDVAYKVLNNLMKQEALFNNKDSIDQLTESLKWLSCYFYSRGIGKYSRNYDNPQHKNDHIAKYFNKTLELIIQFYEQVYEQACKKDDNNAENHVSVVLDNLLTSINNFGNEAFWNHVNQSSPEIQYEIKNNVSQLPVSSQDKLPQQLRGQQRYEVSGSSFSLHNSTTGSDPDRISAEHTSSDPGSKSPENTSSTGSYDDKQRFVSPSSLSP